MKIGILLTSKCNMRCWYCDHKDSYSNDFSLEIDTEYILETLSLFPKHLHVELSGGEPGLVANLVDVINDISSLPNVDSIDVLSNGLAHLRFGSEIFKNEKLKSYREHWLGGDFKNPHSKYEQVVVLTEDNLNYFFLKIGMFYKDSPISDKRIEFKLFTPKVCYPSESYFKKCRDFYKYIRYYMTHPLTREHIQTQLSYITQFEFLNRPQTCYLFPKNVFIDLEKGKIHQCSMAVGESKKHGYDITVDNIRLLLNGVLFNTPMDACCHCYKHDDLYSVLQLEKYSTGRMIS